MRRSLSFLWVISMAIAPALLGATPSSAKPTPALTQAPAATPAAFKGPGSLSAVAALAPRYAWAVGTVQIGGRLETLIVHWNGKTWRRVASPDPKGNDSLGGVAVVSRSNAWAVGENGDHTMILHWNGRSWRRVPSPAKANLAAVAATSPSSAWAVGLGGNNMIIEHWNGRSWGLVKSPIASGQLSGVAATSANNAWAVGSTSNGILVLHWNGASWRRVRAPNPKNGGVFAVTATSADNAWAVGTIAPPNSFLSTVLMLHWNGHSWKRDPASQPPQCGCLMLGVGANSARNAWAVGFDQDHLGFTDIVIEHWQGKRWRWVKSPVQEGVLSGVAVASSGRAWAVGSPDQLGTSLIETWNGSAWR